MRTGRRKRTSTVEGRKKKGEREQSGLRVGRRERTNLAEDLQEPAWLRVG